MLIEGSFVFNLELAVVDCVIFMKSFDLGVFHSSLSNRSNQVDCFPERFQRFFVQYEIVINTQMSTRLLIVPHCFLSHCPRVFRHHSRISQLFRHWKNKKKKNNNNNNNNINNINKEEAMELMENEEVKDGLSVGKGKYGCKHYRRRCRIRAPCCNEIFDCRHCHNEEKNIDELDDSKRHEIPRHRVEKVVCSLCDYEQDVKQVCERCGVCMGDYYCDKCKFFDDETAKKQYHCDACGICRIGGRENYFHCDRCGSCYSTSLQDGHPCVENAMHRNCPICIEYLFDSVMDIAVLPCGHTMHLACLRQMNRHSQFCCPICSKSTQDMSMYWERLDEEVSSTPMPEEYRHKKVWILCNDCGATSNVNYHVIGHKCSECGSYNSRSTSAPSTDRLVEPMSSNRNAPESIGPSISTSVGSQPQLPNEMGT